jgi:hypothetical protein
VEFKPIKNAVLHPLKRVFRVPESKWKTGELNEAKLGGLTISYVIGMYQNLIITCPQINLTKSCGSCGPGSEIQLAGPGVRYHVYATVVTTRSLTAVRRLYHMRGDAHGLAMLFRSKAAQTRSLPLPAFRRQGDELGRDWRPLDDDVMMDFISDGCATPSKASLLLETVQKTA